MIYKSTRVKNVVRDFIVRIDIVSTGKTDGEDNAKC